jgi:hypothetical protein
VVLPTLNRWSKALLVAYGAVQSPQMALHGFSPGGGINLSPAESDIPVPKPARRPDRQFTEQRVGNWAGAMKCSLKQTL